MPCKAALGANLLRWALGREEEGQSLCAHQAPSPTSSRQAPRAERAGGYRRGFSILELLFSTALLAVMSGGVFTLFYANNFASILSGDEGTAMANTQDALRSIAADLRTGAAFETPTHTGGIRAVFPSGPAVEYYRDGSELKRLVASTGNPTTTVVTDLSSSTGLSLTYYDASMRAMAEPMDSARYGQAAAVDVTVTLFLAHSAFGQIIRTTRVVLRNKVN